MEDLKNFHSLIEIVVKLRKHTRPGEAKTYWEQRADAWIKMNYCDPGIIVGKKRAFIIRRP